MSFLDALDPRYRLILCDIWGVVHDGVALYPGAADRLLQWRGDGRCVGLITNAPRTAEAVERQLEGLGLPQRTHDFVTTSGEAGIATLSALGEPVGFIGTRADRANLEERGVVIAVDDAFAHLACAGITADKPEPAQYRAELERAANRAVTLHCLNPDRMIIRGGALEACAGAIADLYESLGGNVIWYGKPFQTIYRHALSLAGDPSADAVLAIGDGLQTDILGAARMGFDAVFVSGGIHRGQPFPPDFAAQHELGEWAPVAIVAGLA